MNKLAWAVRYFVLIVQVPALSVYLCSDVPLTVRSAFYQGPAGPDGIVGKDGDQVRVQSHFLCLYFLFCLLCIPLLPFCI